MDRRRACSALGAAHGARSGVRPTLAGYALCAKHSVVVTGLANDPRFAAEAVLLGARLTGGSVTPIMCKDRPWGLLETVGRLAGVIAGDFQNVLAANARFLPQPFSGHALVLAVRETLAALAAHPPLRA